MKRNGFTLIELMIAVAVIGILAAIAYPSYTEYVKKTRRAEVVAILLEDAQILERFYTQNGTYVGAVIGDQSPTDGTAVYDIAIDDGATTESTFSIDATAVVGGIMDGDTCDALSINESGVQTSTNNAVCWRR